jgi:poly(A) polymerase
MLATRRSTGAIRVRTPDSLRPQLATLRREASAPLFLAGGAVRDLLRGELPADLDFAVEGDAKAIARRMGDAIGGYAFAMDESRGQMRIALTTGPIREIDVAPIKEDIESDLRQRDFTANALGAPVETEGQLGAVIDPTDGLRDIDTKTLRMTSEAALRDDPLRLLRAVRLAVELGFSVEAGTADAVRRNARLIGQAAAERRRDELTRIFATDRAADGLRSMDDFGLLGELIPELLEAHGVSQPENHHYYDVFDHSIEAVAALDALLSRDAPSEARTRDFRSIFRDGMSGFDLDSYLETRHGGQPRHVLLKLAALLHDVSKPETKTIDAEGRIRFLGHPEKGARRAETICRRLRFGNRESAFVALLVDEHLRPTQLAQRGQVPSQRALYRFFRDLGDAAPACLVLQLGDGMAAAGPRLRPERFRASVAYAAFVLGEGERLGETLPPAKRIVTGNDIMEALGIEPGPELGRLLEAAEEAIGAGEVSTKEEAIAYAAGLKSLSVKGPRNAGEQHE